MNKCAIFLDADPFSKKEMNAVIDVEKIYGQVDIFIERECQTKRSILSYNDKADIIKNDLKDLNINYRIHPIDISTYEAITKERIKNVAMIMSSKDIVSQLNEKKMMLLELIEDCNVVFVSSVPQYDVSSEFIQKLVLDIGSKTRCRKYISDYAYFKLKTNMINKIAIERPLKFKDAIDRVLFDRSDKLDVVDIDNSSTDEAYSAIAKAISRSTKHNIVICSSSLDDFGLLADQKIYYGKRSNNLFIDGNDDVEVTRSLILLMNKRLNLNVFGSLTLSKI